VIRLPRIAAVTRSSTSELVRPTGWRARTGARRLVGQVAAWAQRIAAAGPLAWGAIIGALALTVRLPMMFDPSPFLEPDSHGYLTLSDNIVDGHALGSGALTRPLGYPLFIAVVRVFPGRPEVNAMVAQHVLGVAFAIGLLLVGWRFFGKAAGILAGAIAAISPQLVAIEHEVLSDYLFAIFVFAGTVSLAYFALDPSRRLRFLLIPGVLFGIATNIKPLGQVLVVVAPLVLLLVLRRWKPALRGALVVTLGMALIVAPWVVRNEIAAGHPVVSTIGNQVLFWRVFDGANPLPFVGNDPETNLVRDLYARDRADPGPAKVGVWQIAGLLEGRGHSGGEVGSIQREMALRALRAEPIHYLKDSGYYLKEYGRTVSGGTSDDAMTMLTPAYTRAQAAAPSLVRRPVASVSWRALNASSSLADIWWLLSGCGLTGLLLVFSRDRAKRVGAITFAIAWAVLGVALALTALPELRYNLVGAPFLWLLGSAGLLFVVRALAERLRTERRAEGARDAS
jgi:hypothetical protein